MLSYVVICSQTIFGRTCFALSYVVLCCLMLSFLVVGSQTSVGHTCLGCIMLSCVALCCLVLSYVVLWCLRVS